MRAREGDGPDRAGDADSESWPACATSPDSLGARSPRALAAVTVARRTVPVTARTRRRVQAQVTEPASARSAWLAHESCGKARRTARLDAAVRLTAVHRDPLHCLGTLRARALACSSHLFSTPAAKIRHERVVARRDCARRRGRSGSARAPSRAATCWRRAKHVLPAMRHESCRCRPFRASVRVLPHRMLLRASSPPLGALTESEQAMPTTRLERPQDRLRAAA